jgi:hypothetical protein
VTALLTVLIVMVCLAAMTIWILLIAVRLKNRSSTPPSPTQSTTPTPTSDEVALKMMETLNSAWAQQMHETRQMAIELTQGRESPNQIGTQETWPMQSERPIAFDYDSTPLSAGIEAVLEREDKETEQARILREREELQEQLIDKQVELDQFNLEQSSQEGPWSNGSDPRHARTD